MHGKPIIALNNQLNKWSPILSHIITQLLSYFLLYFAAFILAQCTLLLLQVGSIIVIRGVVKKTVIYGQADHKVVVVGG